MGFKIEDATGKSFGLRITPDNRADVSSKSNSRGYYVSRNDEKAFVWASELAATSGVPFLYITNTSETTDLYVHDILVSSDTANKFCIRAVSGTATGPSYTPTNLNRKSGNAADSTSVANAEIGGITNDSDITSLRVGANGSFDLDYQDSLILGKGDAIAIYCWASGNVEANVRGYFE